MNRKQRRALKAREVKMPQKTKEELRNEYFQSCAQAGELQYKIEEFKAQLGALNIKISELNKEYSEAMSSEPKEEVKPEATDVQAPN